MFRNSFQHKRFRKSGFHSHGRNRGWDRKKINYSQNINLNPSLATKEEQQIIHKFADFSLDQRLKQNIVAHGYNTPTPIQDQAIVHILEGRDVIGIANTGTGKTAAFLIPIINKIVNNRAEKVLIIIPTRELAVQIDEEQKAMARGLNIYSLLCIGGASLNGQVSQLRQNPNIIIGTPGRLKDLRQRRLLNFSQFKTIILDEVDRMVDIGFIRDIKYIISLLSSPRQSLFFSATVSSEVNGIIQTFLKNPITVSVKIQETIP